MESTFEEDLEEGKRHENIILEVIQKKYPKAYIKDGYFKEYDIFVPEKEFGIEVKSDQKSRYTGNIVIEIEFNGKPSALSTTEAEYWVIYDGYQYGWFKVSDIWKCIEVDKPKIYEFIGSGDSVAKKAYLIKKRILYKYRIKKLKLS